MSSLSPNDDARRTRPRKSAGQMPHYLAWESNEQKGVKRAKKSGVGLNKWAVAEESESLASSNDDSDSIVSVQPRKKSRGTKFGRTSGGTRSVEFQGGLKWQKGRNQVPVQVLRRGRRHRIIGVMTSPPRVMIWHKKQWRGSTPTRICWRRSKRRTRWSGDWI